MLLTGTTAAQWVSHPTPGIPRLPDGKPNLSAPTPRQADGRPDLSGIWDAGNMIYFHDLARGLKPDDVVLTPWAAAIRKVRMDRNHVDDPYGYCLPLGVPRVYTRSPFKIVHTPSMTIFSTNRSSGTPSVRCSPMAVRCRNWTTWSPRG